MPVLPGPKYLVLLLLIATVLVGGYLALPHRRGLIDDLAAAAAPATQRAEAGQPGSKQAGPAEASSDEAVAEPPFNGKRAYEYLKQICALGRRPSGSPGMAAQQKLVVDHFRKLGAHVELQKFAVRHPRNGSAVPMANVVVQWHPDRQERILLCAHYDTRPYPDRDPERPMGRFIGANDGASGVALLMELGHVMAGYPGPVGIDFVLFDGEEFVFSDSDPYFLGSEWFARDYKANPPGHQYRFGALLDMVADADLELRPDHYSLTHPEIRAVAREIWLVAQRLGVKEFSPEPGFPILDDHIKLHEFGGIPTCDLIDFEYPHWHTEEDTPDKCSAESLAKVGWVVHEWLKSHAKTPQGQPAATEQTPTRSPQ